MGKKKTGRPPIEIPKKSFEYMCGIHCTEKEIAGVFDCDEDTINAWCKREYGETFSEVYKKYQAQGNQSLRRIQFKQAETNPTMAIWLGKQWLGQTDKTESTSTINFNDVSKEIDAILNDIKDE